MTNVVGSLKKDVPSSKILHSRLKRLQSSSICLSIMSERSFPARSAVETQPPMVNVVEDGEGECRGLLGGQPSTQYYVSTCAFVLLRDVMRHTAVTSVILVLCFHSRHPHRSKFSNSGLHRIRSSQTPSALLWLQFIHRPPRISLTSINNFHRLPPCSQFALLCVKLPNYVPMATAADTGQLKDPAKA